MNTSNSIVSLPLRSITTDHAIQQRETLIDGAVVSDYAEAMKDGNQFPPVIVFYDGTTHWLADGYHRLEATDEAGLKEIAAEIREGTRRDAIEHACGANRDHGLRRTRADIRRAITTLVVDAEWGQMANRLIADKVGTSDKTVAAVRKELVRRGNSATEDTDHDTTTSEDQLRNFRSCDDEPDLEGAKADTPPPPPPAPPAKRIGRDGKARAMPKPKAAPKPAPKPSPAVNKARLAMQAAHGLAAALAALEPLEVNLLREDVETVMANLRTALARLEARFGGEVQGHA